MTKFSFPKVSIIGSGKVGSTLAEALNKKGYPIVSIINRTGSKAISLAKKVNCKKVSTEISDIALDTDLIIISTTDDLLGYAAEQLAKNTKLKFRNKFIIHTSGVYSSSVLESLRKKGASVASIHPIQTFSDLQTSSQMQSKIKGIYYGIDGNPESLTRAERLVSDLGGKPIIIDKRLKPLYHIACIFSSGYMIILLNAVKELSRNLNLKASWTEVFGPLMTAAMENAIKYSAPDALTGPIIRGDYTTIGHHLNSLSESAPQFIPLYTVAGIEMARVAKLHGRIENREFKEIISLFKKFIKSNKPTNISKGKK